MSEKFTSLILELVWASTFKALQKPMIQMPLNWQTECPPPILSALFNRLVCILVCWAFKSMPCANEVPYFIYETNRAPVLKSACGK